MANHKATGKKAKRGAELAQRIRAGILNAMDCVEDKKGKLISEILAEELINNPIKFLELASKYVPKELEMELTETVYVINANPEKTVDEWISKSSGNHNQDHKPH